MGSNRITSTPTTNNNSNSHKQSYSSTSIPSLSTQLFPHHFTQQSTRQLTNSHGMSYHNNSKGMISDDAENSTSEQSQFSGYMPQSHSYSDYSESDTGTSDDGDDGNHPTTHPISATTTDGDNYEKMMQMQQIQMQQMQQMQMQQMQFMQQQQQTDNTKSKSKKKNTKTSNEVDTTMSVHNPMSNYMNMMMNMYNYNYAAYNMNAAALNPNDPKMTTTSTTKTKPTKTSKKATSKAASKKDDATTMPTTDPTSQMSSYMNNMMWNPMGMYMNMNMGMGMNPMNSMHSTDPMATAMTGEQKSVKTETKSRSKKQKAQKGSKSVEKQQQLQLQYQYQNQYQYPYSHPYYQQQAQQPYQTYQEHLSTSSMSSFPSSSPSSSFQCGGKEASSHPPHPPRRIRTKISIRTPRNEHIPASVYNINKTVTFRVSNSKPTFDAQGNFLSIVQLPKVKQHKQQKQEKQQKQQKQQKRQKHNENVDNDDHDTGDDEDDYNDDARSDISYYTNSIPDETFQSRNRIKVGDISDVLANLAPPPLLYLPLLSEPTTASTATATAISTATLTGAEVVSSNTTTSGNSLSTTSAITATLPSSSSTSSSYSSSSAFIPSIPPAIMSEDDKIRKVLTQIDTSHVFEHDIQSAEDLIQHIRKDKNESYILKIQNMKKYMSFLNPKALCLNLHTKTFDVAPRFLWKILSESDESSWNCWVCVSNETNDVESSKIKRPNEQLNEQLTTTSSAATQSHLVSGINSVMTDSDSIPPLASPTSTTSTIVNIQGMSIKNTSQKKELYFDDAIDTVLTLDSKDSSSLSSSPCPCLSDTSHICGVLITQQLVHDSSLFEWGAPLQESTIPPENPSGVFADIAEVSVLCAKSCGQRILQAAIKYLQSVDVVDTCTHTSTESINDPKDVKRSKSMKNKNYTPTLDSSTSQRYKYLITSSTTNAEKWYRSQGFKPVAAYRVPQPKLEDVDKPMSVVQYATQLADKYKSHLYRHRISDENLDVTKDEPSIMMYYPLTPEAVAVSMAYEDECKKGTVRSVDILDYAGKYGYFKQNDTIIQNYTRAKEREKIREKEKEEQERLQKDALQQEQEWKKQMELFDTILDSTNVDVGTDIDTAGSAATTIAPSDLTTSLTIVNATSSSSPVPIHIPTPVPSCTPVDNVDDEEEIVFPHGIGIKWNTDSLDASERNVILQKIAREEQKRLKELAKQQTEVEAKAVPTTTTTTPTAPSTVSTSTSNPNFKPIGYISEYNVRKGECYSSFQSHVDLLKEKGLFNMELEIDSIEEEKYKI